MPPAFPASPPGFRERLFPQASAAEWADWRWQMRHRIRDRAGLERVFTLSDDERAAVDRLGGSLPLAITPYYASLIDPANPAHPLRRTKIPVGAEFQARYDEREDPLGEEAHSPAPGIVHTYPDKVLLLATDFCATYCRYCTRARLVGGGELPPSADRWEQSLAYIAAHTEIRDVLLSGGDPLTLADDKLDALLGRLRAIPHVEIIRIGTKIPAVLPQRVTPALADMLRRHHPLLMSLHFIHPAELTAECAEACARLADAGIPLGGQMVLLKGVNDDPATLLALCNGQLRMRVRPYYLHQCDPITGSAHFRTPVSAGLDLIRSLHGNTTGYAIPQYMIDAPGGGGKVPLLPDFTAGRQDGFLLLKNRLGEIYRYWDDWPEPAPRGTV